MVEEVEDTLHVIRIQPFDATASEASNGNVTFCMLELLLDAGQRNLGRFGASGIFHGTLESAATKMSLFSAADGPPNL